MSAKPQPLFDYFLVVKLSPNVANPDAFIDMRFPSSDLPKEEVVVMNMISQFCFPDKELFPRAKISPKNKKFTFVVTDVDGQKRFGYCYRRLLGHNFSGKRWPICYCILSRFPSHVLFGKILEEALALEDVTDTLRLMVQIRDHARPQPGDVIKASLTLSETNELRFFAFQRPLNDLSLMGFADMTVLFQSLDPMTITIVILAMLIERRIILISSKLSMLSNIAQGFLALIYPFLWQHIFIPVLPLNLLEFTTAPVPFLVGVMANHFEEMEKYAGSREEVIMIDLDQSVVSPIPSDYLLVPESILMPFLDSIRSIKAQVSREMKKDSFMTLNGLGKTLKKLVKSPISYNNRLHGLYNNSLINYNMMNLNSSGRGNSMNLSDSNHKQILPNTQSVSQELLISDHLSSHLQSSEFHHSKNFTDKITHIFQQLFSSLIGHYGLFIDGEKRCIDREGFIQYRPEISPFLTMMAGSQLFEQFIEHSFNEKLVDKKSRMSPSSTSPPIPSLLSSSSSLRIPSYDGKHKMDKNLPSLRQTNSERTTLNPSYSLDKSSSSPTIPIQSNISSYHLLDLNNILFRDGCLKKFGRGKKETALGRFSENRELTPHPNELLKGVFQCRYWTLNYFWISYYKPDKVDFPLGTIMLVDISNVELVEFRNLQNCLELTTKFRVYLLYSNNLNNILYWKELIQWRVKIAQDEKSKAR